MTSRLSPVIVSVTERDRGLKRVSAATLAPRAPRPAIHDMLSPCVPFMPLRLIFLCEEICNTNTTFVQVYTMAVTSSRSCQLHSHVAVRALRATSNPKKRASNNRAAFGLERSTIGCGGVVEAGRWLLHVACRDSGEMKRTFHDGDMFRHILQVCVISQTEHRPRVDDGGVTADGGDGSKNGYKYTGVIRP